MKRVLVCVCVLCLGVLLGAGAAHATNILSNPGFESGSLGPWTVVGLSGCVAPQTCVPWTVSTTVSHSGMDSAVDLGDIGLMQTFGPVADSSITDVSFDVMHPLAQSQPVPVMVILGYSNGTTFSVPGLSTTTTSWNLEDVTSFLDPSLSLDSITVFGAVQFPSVFFNGQASSDFTYLDDFDVNVAGTSSATPEPDSLLLLGTGLIGAAGLLRRFSKSA